MRSPPSGFDLSVRWFTGDAALTAWVLTWALYMYWLAPLCVLLLLFAWRYPQWRAAAVATTVSLLVTWLLSDAFQHFYHRPRRLDWVVKHETAFSYPSTHASLAVAYYGFWAFIILKSSLPPQVRTMFVSALGLLIAGVFWARLALGAHYPTDIIGGTLLGIAVICATVAVAFRLRVRLSPQAAPAKR